MEVRLNRITGVDNNIVVLMVYKRNINLEEFAHVYKIRNEDATANTEVQESTEKSMRRMNYPFIRI